MIRLMVYLVISIVFVSCNKPKIETGGQSAQSESDSKAFASALSDCGLAGSMDDDTTGKIVVFIVHTETGDAEGEEDVVCMLHAIGIGNKAYGFLFNYPSSGIELEKDSVCAEVSYKAEFLENGDEENEKILWATSVKYIAK